MKRLYSYILILLAAYSSIRLNAQCVSAPVKQTSQSQVSNQINYGFNNQVLFTLTKKDTAKTKKYQINIYENGRWFQLNPLYLKSELYNLCKWKGQYVVYGDVRYYNRDSGIADTMGFLTYKNGVWDTLPGGTIQSTSKFLSYIYGSTDHDLYLKLEDQNYKGLIYKYDTITQKLKLIITTEPYPGLSILFGSKFLYLIGANFVNNIPTKGFSYYVNDSLKVNLDTNYKRSQIWTSYSIDKSRDELIYVNYTNRSGVVTKRFKRTTLFTDTTQFTFPFYADGSQHIGIATSQLIIAIGVRPIDRLRYAYIRCNGSNTWRVMSMKDDEWSYYMLQDDTLYQINLKNHLTYYLGNGNWMSGTLFLDFDEDCQKDSNDLAVSGQIVEMRDVNDKNGHIYLTDQSGYFSGGITLGTYKLKGPTELTACSDDSLTISGDTSIQNLSLKVPTDIYFECPNYNIRTVRWTFPGQITYYFKNYGRPLDSVKMRLRSRQGLRLDTCNLPFSRQHDTAITISLGQMDYFERRYFSISFSHDTSLYHLGDTGYYDYELLAYGGSDSLRDSSGGRILFTYSYDPNHKLVSKDRIPVKNDTRLDYLIEFQNEGNDDAYDVVIVDSLPTSLNLKTFRITEVSHPFEASLNGHVLTVKFQNIFLKPKKTDEALSKGFISFKIDNYPDMANGETIKNKAYIYFDLNAPIITNEAITEVSDKVLSVSSHSYVSPRIQVYPNPGQNVLHIQSETLVEIFNSMGQLVGHFEPVNGELVLNIEDWPSGMYFIRNTRESVVFIKTE